MSPSSPSTGVAAELSSVATALAELTKRVSAIAEAHVGGQQEDLAHDLFEVERALTGASRRLSRLVERA